MARTKAQIVDAIQQNFLSNPILQQIYGTTSSNWNGEFSLVSLESQLIEVMGTEIKTLEDLFDVLKAEIAQLINEKVPGTEYWYRQQALNFQFGYTLQWNANSMRFEYPLVDELARIVKLASVKEVSGQLIVKLAKLNNVTNLPEPLTSAELIAFRNYFERVKFAGVNISYISRQPDLLRLALKVFYDPTVLNANGSMLTNPSVFPVNDKIDEFLQLQPFNGTFNITDLIDVLQTVPGVINPIFQSASAQYGTQPFVAVTDYYIPNAGYMIIDPLTPPTINYATL